MNHVPFHDGPKTPGRGDKEDDPDLPDREPDEDPVPEIEPDAPLEIPDIKHKEIDLPPLAPPKP